MGEGWTAPHLVLTAEIVVPVPDFSRIIHRVVPYMCGLSCLHVYPLGQESPSGASEAGYRVWGVG